jgi:hypothetical protein
MDTLKKYNRFFEFIIFNQIGDDIDYELDSIENIKRLMNDINEIFDYEENFNFNDSEIEEISIELLSW